MHPSRQAYVEEAAPEVSLVPPLPRHILHLFALNFTSSIHLNLEEDGVGVDSIRSGEETRS